MQKTKFKVSTANQIFSKSSNNSKTFSLFVSNFKVYEEKLQIQNVLFPRLTRRFKSSFLERQFFPFQSNNVILLFSLLRFLFSIKANLDVSYLYLFFARHVIVKNVPYILRNNFGTCACDCVNKKFLGTYLLRKFYGSFLFTCLILRFSIACFRRIHFFLT